MVSPSRCLSQRSERLRDLWRNGHGAGCLAMVFRASKPSALPARERKPHRPSISSSPCRDPLPKTPVYPDMAMSYLSHEGGVMITRRLRRPRPMHDFVAATSRTPRTIRRHVAEPRTEYEARSLSRAQPWVAAGISRSTWYRRQRLSSKKGCQA